MTLHIDSKKFKAAAILLSAFIVLLLVFQAGVSVGYKKAAFSYKSGESFYRVFGHMGRGSGEMIEPPGFVGGFVSDIPGGHGAVGQIVSMDLPSLVIAGPDNVEKVITTDGATMVRRSRDTVSLSDMRVSDHVIVLGDPNGSGQIRARLIRVMPR